MDVNAFMLYLISSGGKHIIMINAGFTYDRVFATHVSYYLINMLIEFICGMYSSVYYINLLRFIPQCRVMFGAHSQYSACPKDTSPS